MNLHKGVFEKFGYEMSYFRPPKGEFSSRVISIAKDLGYTTVMWSSAYDDWDKEKQGRQEYGKKKIIDNIHNGCVLLLHATSSDNSEILSEVIDKAKDMGYYWCTFDSTFGSTFGDSSKKCSQISRYPFGNTFGDSSKKCSQTSHYPFGNIKTFHYI